MTEPVNQINWEYTATWKKHFAWDDNYTDWSRGKHCHCHLWEICPCIVAYGYIHNKSDGYDLYYKGKKIKHGKTVKELKQIARLRLDKERRGLIE